MGRTYGDDGDLASWWEGQLTFRAVVNIGGVGSVDFFNKSHGMGRRACLLLYGRRRRWRVLKKGFLGRTGYQKVKV